MRRADESLTASMAFVGTISASDSLFFAGWREVLAASGVTPAAKAAREREIVRFLHRCEQRHADPTIGRARQNLAGGPAGATPVRDFQCSTYSFVPIPLPDPNFKQRAKEWGQRNEYF